MVDIRETRESLSSTIAGTVAPDALPYGRRWMFLGDSITAGSSASTSTYFYTTRLGTMTGTEAVVVNRQGFPGERSDLLLDRLPGLLTAHTPDVVHIQCGTNDAGASVTPDVFMENVAAMKALCAAARIPVTIGTVPPRDSATAAGIHLLLRAYNSRLYRWATDNAIPCADVHGALVDPATGYLAAAYDSGDGVHPNDAGHLAIATAMATITDRALLAPWPVTYLGGGLLPNPLNDPAITPGTAGWVAVSGVATAVSTEDPVEGDGLTAGKWFKIRYDNSGGGSSVSVVRQMTFTPGTYSEGDRIAIFARFKRDNGCLGKVQIARTGSTSLHTLIDAPAADIPASGLIGAYDVTASDVSSQLKLQLVLTAPAGVHGSVYIGQQEVYNLTTGQLAGLY